MVRGRKNVEVPALGTWDDVRELAQVGSETGRSHLTVSVRGV